MRLKDKVAIVTAGGSGFGEGIATRFAREGAKLLIADINAPAGARWAREIGAQFVAADVTQSADWAKLVRAAGPSLEIVINNAGWTHRNEPYLEVTEGEFDKVYAVNVKSVYLSALHAVPVFRKRGGGGFVNIASTARTDGLQQLEGSGDPDVEIDGCRVRPGSHSRELRQSGVQPGDLALGGVRGRRAHRGIEAALLVEHSARALRDAAGRSQRLPLPRVRRCRLCERCLHRG